MLVRVLVVSFYPPPPLKLFGTGRGFQNDKRTAHGAGDGREVTRNNLATEKDLVKVFKTY